MLTERRLAIATRALTVEILELWGAAVQPPHRVPPEIIAKRQQDYFQGRLNEAVIELSEGSLELLAEVLEEISAIAIGEEEIVNWRPLSLEEARSRIGEPIVATAMETNVAQR
jgi:hypothetical protein